PLFAIDLTNPSAPAILGALKIPGYSDYLHPYDETHLIGFGKETVEVPVKGNSSNPTQTIAYYQGMKLSLFDVSDVSNPVEQFKTIIGDRGTDSELLRNHKALLFSRQNNLLAFPVTVMTVANKPGGAADSPSAYGQFTFQGAYVYELDLTNGFRQKAAITHMTDEQLRAAGTGWYNSERNVERILYIGDTLYTLSKQVIQANDMNSFQLKGSLQIP
ncbi:MAG: beta propeller protein, partial [Paenibacillus sp.]|nr:beta propeller protein [Paenibacillus sp.]